MGLWERVVGTEEPKIAVHAFFAMASERRRGKVTDADVYNAFGLSAGEQTEFQTFLALLNKNVRSAQELHEVLIAAESGLAPYDTVAAVKTRLGV
jgi:hypothetical protein